MNIDDLLDELVALDGPRSNGANFWGKWCKAIHQERIRDVAKLSRFSYLFETAYKRRQGQSCMPGAYKSAKCTMNKALSCGIPYMDGEGNPRPKSDVFYDRE